MTRERAADVDAYIAAAPEEARDTLRAMQDVFLTAVPDAEEKILWGVPFYRRLGDLGGFAAYAKHVSVGIPVDLDADDRAELRDGGYRTGKKTVQVRFDQDVPVGILSRMLTAQAERNAAAAAAPD